MPVLTVIELRQLLSYNKRTGVFKWRIAPPRKPNFVGRVAGCLDHRGYRLIKIKGVMYRAGRLAWFYTTGAWPDPEIDHDDGNTSNDAFRNLKEATRVRQLHNRHRVRNDSETGLMGVHHASKNSWSAEIRFNGERIKLGSYPSPKQAGRAYRSAKAFFHAAP